MDEKVIFEKMMNMADKMSKGEAITVDDYLYDICKDKMFVLLDKRGVYMDCRNGYDDLYDFLKPLNVEPVCSTPHFMIFKFTTITKKEYLDKKFNR